MEDGSFLLRRSGLPDVRFAGHVVAAVSSKADPPQKRWRNYAIYRTKSGKLVLEKEGITTMPGEEDRHKVLILDDLEAPSKEIIKFFGRDSLAKDLYADAEISDVEVIE